MKTVLLAIGCIFSGLVFSQATPSQYTMWFYEALNEGDSTAIARFLSEDVEVIHSDKDTTFSFNYEEFMTICPKFKSGKFKEKVKVLTETKAMVNRAVVEVEFEFFLNGKSDHSGWDIITWDFTDSDGYKIQEIFSTPYPTEELDEMKAGILNSTIERLNGLMDNWHEAAADAAYDKYFDFMSDGFYFLGTADGERWSKPEFAEFCKPYFDKGKAWDFTPSNRNWYFNDDYTIAWFDEDLSTWMEDCRGTGVLRRDIDYEWTIDHYNLTVLIENEKIKEFIQLRKK